MYRPKIFVSHRSSPDDLNFATRVAAFLKQGDAEVWIDLNDLGDGGVDTPISEALDRCDWFVLILTPSATDPHSFVREEVDAARSLAREKRIRIAFLECVRTPDIPSLWRSMRRLDATKDFEQGLVSLKGLIWKAIVPDELPEGRAYHTALPLDDATFLIAGGMNSVHYLNETLLFNHAEGSWQQVGSLTAMRSRAAGAALPNGAAVIAGGAVGAVALDTLEVYDPARRAFSTRQLKLIPRFDHSCANLTDGRVLVIGGADGMGWISSVEILDVHANSITLVHDLLAPVRACAVVRLYENAFLLVGGDRGQGADRWTELYHPTRGVTDPGPQLLTPRQDHVAITLSHKKVLVAGGRNARGIVTSIELLDCVSNTASLVCDMHIPRYGFTASLIGSRNVLFVGGIGVDGIPVLQPEVFNLTKLSVGNSYSLPRSAHT